MVIDSGQSRTLAAPRPAAGFAARAMEQLRQFVCGLHGHDSLLHFEKGRMSLQCVSCGYETPGWDLKTESPRPSIANTRSRLQLPLVSERRVA